MKRLITILLISLLGYSMMAQNDGTEKDKKDIPTPEWQIGLVVTDIVIPSISLDASIEVAPRNHIGIRLASPQYQSFSDYDLYQRSNWAFKGGIYHKVFMPLDEYDMFTFRHGIRFGISELEFDATVWDPYQNNGNTYLEYRDVSYSDQPISLGYEIMAGWQNNFKSLYFEIYFGLSYEFINNASDLKAVEYKGEDFSLDYFGPGYEYNSSIRPIMGLVIGLTDPY
tara:strand:- start:1044 stop:1721 length:678 start_codon:yes stop_codon:yes gene_type:complete